MTALVFILFLLFHVCMYVGIFSVTIYPSIPSSTSTPTPAISFDFKYVNSLFLVRASGAMDK